MVLSHNIEQEFHNWRFDSRVIILNLLSKIRRILNFSLRTGLIKYFTKKIIKWTRKVYFLSEDIKNDVLKNCVVVDKDFHNISEQVLLRYIKMYSKLEQSEFLDNSQIKTLSEKTLQNLYFIESRSRFLSITEKSNNSDDDCLNEYASILSLGSLQPKDAI